MTHPQRTSASSLRGLAAIIAVTLPLLSGCGTSLADIAGTWTQQDVDDPVTLEIQDDGELLTRSHDGSACTGSVTVKDEEYRLLADCGFGKGTATLTLSEEDDTLTLLQGQSDPQLFSRDQD